MMDAHAILLPLAMTVISCCRTCTIPRDVNNVTVAGHGNTKQMQWEVFPVNPKEFSEKIKKHPGYSSDKPLKLFSCEVGKGENSFAQQVANELGQIVIAPNDLIKFYSNGTTEVTNGGRGLLLLPLIKRRKINARI